jgi:hypothetical protein
VTVPDITDVHACSLACGSGRIAWHIARYLAPLAWSSSGSAARRPGAVGARSPGRGCVPRRAAIAQRTPPDRACATMGKEAQPRGALPAAASIRAEPAPHVGRPGAAPGSTTGTRTHPPARSIPDLAQISAHRAWPTCRLAWLSLGLGITGAAPAGNAVGRWCVAFVVCSGVYPASGSS